VLSHSPHGPGLRQFFSCFKIILFLLTCGMTKNKFASCTEQTSRIGGARAVSWSQVLFTRLSFVNPRPLPSICQLQIKSIDKKEKRKQKTFVTLYDHVHCCTCIFGPLDLMIHELKKENNMSLPRFCDNN
jgi:hypothetical protein